MARKKRHKYKRKSKKNGKPKLSSKRKWLIGAVLFAILVLAGLILFLFVKPEFLEGVFQKNSDANVNTGASSQAKEGSTNSGSSTSNSAPSTSSSQPATRVALFDKGPTDYSSYYANLPNILSQNPMVQDLPKGETILLRFYNFNTGYREFEKSFILTTGNAKEGFLDNPEITIVIHSKYLPEINSNNLCETISKAEANNDVGVYTDLGATKLILKFKSMMEYKDCLM